MQHLGLPNCSTAAQAAAAATLQGSWHGSLRLLVSVSTRSAPEEQQKQQQDGLAAMDPAIHAVCRAVVDLKDVVLQQRPVVLDKWACSNFQDCTHISTLMMRHDPGRSHTLHHTLRQCERRRAGLDQNRVARMSGVVEGRQQPAGTPAYYWVLAQVLAGELLMIVHRMCLCVVCRSLIKSL